MGAGMYGMLGFCCNLRKVEYCIFVIWRCSISTMSAMDKEKGRNKKSKVTAFWRLTHCVKWMPRSVAWVEFPARSGGYNLCRR